MAVGIWAHVEDGVCVNTIMLDPEDCGDYPTHNLVELGEHPLPPGSPGIGWSYDGTSWTPPPPAEE